MIRIKSLDRTGPVDTPTGGLSDPRAAALHEDETWGGAAEAAPGGLPHRVLPYSGGAGDNQEQPAFRLIYHTVNSGRPKFASNRPNPNVQLAALLALFDASRPDPPHAV